jgi:hypothetical protein
MHCSNQDLCRCKVCEPLLAVVNAIRVTVTIVVIRVSDGTGREAED